MTAPRIKFCGITRLQDASDAVASGADLLGFVFSRRSSRFIDTAFAAALRAQLPPEIQVVALFMDDSTDWISQVIAAVKPDLLQFHGDESAAECAAYDIAYIKAVAMASVTDVASYAARYADADGLVLDAHASGETGGSGAAFDWSRVSDFPQPLWLAGGLHAGNVAHAIAQTRPAVVDVSSGIETAPGIKDVNKMRAFVRAVRGPNHPASEVIP